MMILLYGNEYLYNAYPVAIAVCVVNGLHYLAIVYNVFYTVCETVGETITWKYMEAERCNHVV